MKQEVINQSLDIAPIVRQFDFLTSAILGGYVNPLDAQIQIKRVENALKAMKEQIKEVTLEEAEKYTRESYNALGAKLEVRNAATRYSYKHITKWVDAKDILTDIETNAKAALKANEKGLIISDYDGEIVKPCESSGGGRTVFITFKKNE